MVAWIHWQLLKKLLKENASKESGIDTHSEIKMAMLAKCKTLESGF